VTTVLADQSPAQRADSDLYEAFALLGQEPVAVRAERTRQLRQLMLAELDAQQARRARWGWLLGKPHAALRVATAVAAVVMVLLLGAAVVLQGLFPAASGAQVAQVDVTAGVVAITRAVPIVGGVELTRRLTVESGQTAALRAGDQLDSDADTDAAIAFVGGSESTLGPSAHLVITELQQGTDSSPLVIAMRLERGAMRSAVAGLRPAVDKFEVSMPGLVAHVKGTVFRVDVRPNMTYLATDEGVVQVRYDGTTAEVAAGEELAVLLRESASVAWVRPQAPRLALAAPLPPTAPAVSGEDAVLYTGEPTLAWRIETLPNASVRVYINGELQQTVTADVNGAVVLDFAPPAEGTYVMTADIETVTGETSRLSEPQTVVFDRTPPSLVLTSPQDPQVSGESVNVAGKTEAGAHLTINGQPATVDAEGNFAVDLALTPGPYELRLTVADRAGNEVQLNSVLIVE
jgi:hypothetical protein